MKEQKLTRRSFLGLGATAAVAAGAAGLAGCAPAAKSDAADAAAGDAGATSAGGAAGGNPTEFTPSFLNPPAAIDESKVTETVDTDVCVVGLGLAGVCALREAAEQGAKVFGFDKGPDVGYRSGEFGTFGSEIHKQLGIEQPETQEVVNELMKVMGNRPNAQLLNYWIGNSGPDLDWYIGSAEHELLTSDHDTPTDPEKPYVFPERCPANENYNWREENYPCFPGMVHLLPDHGWAMHGTLEAAQKAGAEARFNLKGEQLIKEGDKVVGAYAKTKDGYLKVNAKATVLCCGDYGANPEMRHYYAPWTEEFMGGVDDGRGQLMGIWAGGWMELGPHAPMTHHMGGALGVDSFLQLNMEGRRFMNEDVPGQNIADEHTRQPVAKDPELAKAGVKSWQIFDSKWPEQIINMPDGHGYTTYFVPDDKIEEYETVLSGFGLGYTTQAMVDEAADVKCDTLEELAEKTGLPFETMKAEIERYNELCHNGLDEDFGKMSKRMFPVENPPYYACKFGNAGMLVMFGGLECNHDLQVTADGTNDPIPGLYVAGNTMGRRLQVDYPVVVAGISLATALSFGRLAGKNAAASV